MGAAKRRGNRWSSAAGTFPVVVGAFAGIPVISAGVAMATAATTRGLFLPGMVRVFLPNDCSALYCRRKSRPKRAGCGPGRSASFRTKHRKGKDFPRKTIWTSTSPRIGGGIRPSPESLIVEGRRGHFASTTTDSLSRVTWDPPSTNQTQGRVAASGGPTRPATANTSDSRSARSRTATDRSGLPGRTRRRHIRRDLSEEQLPTRTPPKTRRIHRSKKPE